MKYFASTLIWSPFDFSWNISREGGKNGSDKNDTRMTQKLHKCRVVPVERAVARAGGLGVAQRSRGSTCIGKTLGKHWKTFGNAPTPGQVPISLLLDICYIFVGQLKWLFTFCAVQGQVRLVRMRGNVNEIPSKLMLKKVMLTKYKIPSKETREEPFRFAHPRPHFRNSSPFLVDFRFLQISHHFHFPWMEGCTGNLTTRCSVAPLTWNWT